MPKGNGASKKSSGTSSTWKGCSVIEPTVSHGRIPHTCPASTRWIMREAPTPPPGPLAELVDELNAVRQSNIASFRSLDDAMWSHRGIGSDCEFTVRAIAYIIVGHEIHHRSVIEERYLNAT